jgi:hypothetical protein
MLGQKPVLNKKAVGRPRTKSNPGAESVATPAPISIVNSITYSGVFFDWLHTLINRETSSWESGSAWRGEAPRLAPESERIEYETAFNCDFGCLPGGRRASE